MKKVVILMSTYNGEKYLKEQLDSLEHLDKIDLQIDIKIRDDGSKDSTRDILNNYSQIYSNITWYHGSNKGPAYSFLELLSNQKNYDYYAFCDQDDVWEKPKIIEAVKKLEKYDNKPSLYFSAVNLVDANLKFITKNKLDINLSLETSLMANPVIGCTLVINNRLKEIIDKSQIDGEIGMHDSWIYRISQCLGANIIYDDNSYIKYRQHGNNVMGINTNKNLLQKISYFTKKRKRPIGNVCELILKNYEKDINNINYINVLKNISELSKKHNLKTKIYVLKNKNFKSTNKKENIKFKFDVLFNRI